MDIIPQNNPTGCKIPFWIAANSGNFQGAGGANPSIELSRESSPAWVPATGAIQDVGNGGYWYTPSQQDTAISGKVLMRVIGPNTDILPPREFVVQAPSWWQQLFAAPQNLATAVSLLQRLVTAQRA